MQPPISWIAEELFIHIHKSLYHVSRFAFLFPFNFISTLHFYGFHHDWKPIKGRTCQSKCKWRQECCITSKHQSFSLLFALFYVILPFEELSLVPKLDTFISFLIMVSNKNRKDFILLLTDKEKNDTQIRLIQFDWHTFVVSKSHFLRNWVANFDF